MNRRAGLALRKPAQYAVGCSMGDIEHPKEVIVRWTIAVAGLILVCAAPASAQKLDVKIIDRQDKEDEYDYAAVYNNVAVGKSFKVHGATFTLQLPDGRLAIVNCESKFAEHMAGRVGNRRSCRTPVVDSIQADFKGDNAKLIWPVSLDGKKMQSENIQDSRHLGQAEEQLGRLARSERRSEILCESSKPVHGQNGRIV